MAADAHDDRSADRFRLKPSWPLYLANRPQETGRWLAVSDKFTGDDACRVSQAGPEHVERAIAMACNAAPAMRAMPSHARRAVLNHCAHRFTERADELADALCVEAGKPIRDCRGEVARLIDTFRLAGDEALRAHAGEVLPLDVSPRAEGYRGMTRRVPVGPCAFITPFNFPLNLVAHKVAPAIAAGCPFVLKPADLTPVGALIVGEVLAEADLPAGAFSILPMKVEHASPLVEDDRLKLLSFTGSTAVGWALKAKAGKKKVVLELGGDAAAVLDETLTEQDLEDAVQRLIVGAFYQSGQSCIGVQRILAHRSIYATLRDRLVEATRKLAVGDPKLEETFVGPIITGAHAERIERWVQEAVDAGATRLCGGGRDGRVVEPTLLENVPGGVKLACEEAFGPVAHLSAFEAFDEALERVNASRFGLQAGVFTRDVHRVMQAWDVLEVGGVVANDVPSWRVDHMPYGGVKDSGLGREGLRYAIEDMTEPRLLVLRDRPTSPA
ncbi:MAG: aldehyde dehydrogenase family protein [Planctomycetota bacterium]